MKTNNFLGRDWIDAELDFSKEEWETLINISLELKKMHALRQDQTQILSSEMNMLFRERK